MPRLISWRNGEAYDAKDTFVDVADEDALGGGDIVLSVTRLLAEGGDLLGEGRRIGARLAAGEPVEALAPFLPRLALVVLEFPKFRDGRPYSAAAILRQRLCFAGEVRAVGDVLREQAGFMVRAGFDAFIPADGSSADDWTRAARRYRHVYQRAADGRAPAFDERLAAAPRRLAA